MDNSMTISVIIPVYNIREYIERCVNSVIKQTYHKLEIILVDDGSTDGSDVVCDNLAQQDKRIIVIHKKNGGASDARNAGIEKSSGEILSFIDGDDYIDHRMYEIMMKEFDDKISMVVCGMKVLDYDGKCTRNSIWNLSGNELLSREDCFRAFLKGGNNGFEVSCGNKIFRRELFEDIRFTKGIVSEDVECLYRILDKIENCMCVNESFYIYAGRRESVSKSPFYEQRMDALETARQVREFVEINYPRLQEMAYSFELSWLVICWNWVQDATDKKICIKWEQEIRNRIKTNLEVNGRRKVIGNYLFVSSHAILLGCDKMIHNGFELWFGIKRWARKNGRNDLGRK